MKNVIRLFLFSLVALGAYTAMACDVDYTGDCVDPTPTPTLNVSINASSPLSWNEGSNLQLRSSVSWSDGSRVAYPVFYTWVVDGTAQPNPNDGTFSITPVTMALQGGYVRLSIIDSQGNRAQSQAVVFNVIAQQSSGGGGGGAQVADCSITRPNGNQIYDNQLSQADCSSTCNNILGNHPYVSCQWNGGTELAPVQSCALYGPRGNALLAFNSLLSQCESRCNGARSSHPNIGCSWGDDGL